MGILEAGSHFKGNRLPELFTGFSKDKFDVPVHYPVAGYTQAWAAGSIPYMLTSFLDLEPAAFDHILCVPQPILPGFVNTMEMHRLHIGSAKVYLRYEWKPEGSVRARGWSRCLPSAGKGI